MTVTDENGTIFPTAGGFLTCPNCGKQKLQRLEPDTEAHALPVYCSRCRREYKIDIRRARA